MAPTSPDATTPTDGGPSLALPPLLTPPLPSPRPRLGGVAVLQVILRSASLSSLARRAEVLAELEAAGAHVDAVDDEHGMAEVTGDAGLAHRLAALACVAYARTVFTFLAGPPTPTGPRVERRARRRAA